MVFSKSGEMTVSKKSRPGSGKLDRAAGFPVALPQQALTGGLVLPEKLNSQHGQMGPGHAVSSYNCCIPLFVAFGRLLHELRALCKLR